MHISINICIYIWWHFAAVASLTRFRQLNLRAKRENCVTHRKTNTNNNNNNDKQLQQWQQQRQQSQTMTGWDSMRHGDNMLRLPHAAATIECCMPLATDIVKWKFIGKGNEDNSGWCIGFRAVQFDNPFSIRSMHANKHRHARAAGKVSAVHIYLKVGYL